MTRARGSSGLGLSITRQLVELMGGKISVESERGRGSSLPFGSFPAGAAGRRDAAGTTAAAQAACPAGGRECSQRACHLAHLASWQVDATIVSSVEEAKAAWQGR
jgi:hypothetical protein